VRRGLLLLGLSVVGCAPAEDARAQWLRHTLVLDNQAFLERTPALTAGKFGLMGESLYPFFRGTAPLYARDTLIPGGPGYQASAFVTAENRDVLLVGDPHPENIGTYRRPNGALAVEFNDFDASTYGPFTFDVRRLALGFFIAGVQVEQAAEPDALGTLLLADRRAAVEAMAGAYVDAITSEDPEETEARDCTVVVDLIDKAIEDGDVLEKLEDYTELDGAMRTMFDGDVDPARTIEFGEFTQLIVEDSVRPPPRSQRDRLLELVALYQETVDVPGEVLGVSQRFGSGVSSYPQERYYVLFSGPSDDPNDDVLLEAKETTDPVVLPGLESLPNWSAQSNGERVVEFQRELHASRGNDVYLGWATTGGQSFRFRHRTAYQRGFRVSRMGEKLAEGEWVAADFVEFAAFAGALLGRTHARGATQRGTSAGASIAAALRGNREAFVAETVDFVETYAPMVVEDVVRMRVLLETHGMTLGY
jgi:uncharacterized protein (DUF2252 family)